MMANFVVSFDGSFLKYSARSWLSPYSLGAGAGAMLKKTENRGAECWRCPGAGSGHLSPLVGRKAAAWCSCCRLDTGLVTTLPLRTLTGGQVSRSRCSRCCTQVLGPGEDVPSDGHLRPDPLRGHAPGLRVPAAAALLREVLRAGHHRHRRHRHRGQGQQRRVQSSAVRGGWLLELSVEMERGFKHIYFFNLISGFNEEPSYWRSNFPTKGTK